MYQNKIRIVLMIMCGWLFFACSEDKDQLPQWVYLASPVGTQPVSVTDMMEEGRSDTTLLLRVKYGLSEGKTATVEAVVEPDLQLVAAYNQSKSKSLTAFPEANISFPSTQVSIAPGTDEASVSFRLVNLDLLESGEYLLPVTIKSVTASNGFTLNETSKTAYYQISNKSAMLKGRWLFEDATNLGKATTGSDLQPVGAGFTSIDGPNGSKAVRIALGSYYKCIHGIAASSGSDRVDEYTLLMDVRYPATNGNWYAFYNNSPNLDESGLWLDGSNGKVGVGHLGYSTGTLQPGVWSRVVISVKKGDWVKIYFNGVLAHNPSSGLTHARLFLDPAGLVLSGDKDGWDTDFDVAEVQIYDGALSEARAKKLGSAGD